MEPESSIPHSQQPATCPYPEQYQRSCRSNLLHLRPIFILILPSKPISFKSSLSLNSTNETLHVPLLSTIRITFPAHLIPFDLINRIIISGEDYRSINSSLCSPLHFPVTSSLLGPNIFLTTLLSKPLSLRFSHNVKYEVLRPYKGTAVAQWLRCSATNRTVAVSIPAGVIGIFH